MTPHSAKAAALQQDRSKVDSSRPHRGPESWVAKHTNTGTQLTRYCTPAVKKKSWTLLFGPFPPLLHPQACQTTATKLSNPPRPVAVPSSTLPSARARSSAGHRRRHHHSWPFFASELRATLSCQRLGRSRRLARGTRRWSFSKKPAAERVTLIVGAEL